jgi:hypothetical protein
MCIFIERDMFLLYNQLYALMRSFWLFLKKCNLDVYIISLQD